MDDGSMKGGTWDRPRAVSRSCEAWWTQCHNGWLLGQRARCWTFINISRDQTVSAADSADDDGLCAVYICDVSSISIYYAWWISPLLRIKATTSIMYRVFRASDAGVICADSPPTVLRTSAALSACASPAQIGTRAAAAPFIYIYISYVCVCKYLAGPGESQSAPRVRRLCVPTSELWKMLAAMSDLMSVFIRTFFPSAALLIIGLFIGKNLIHYQFPYQLRRAFKSFFESDLRPVGWICRHL